ncbi:MAG: FKBP-type peptidyl-prolyl cis-trans isomerase [Verrucomicrobiota bacterium]
MLRAMGYFMSERLGLEIGLTEDELDHVLEGMRRQALGEARPDEFDTLVREAQQLYLTKRREQRSSEAAANRAAAKELLAQVTAGENTRQTESGLVYEIHEEGAAPLAKDGDLLRVQYTAKRADGSTFESNDDLTIPLGGRRGSIPPGIVEGLKLLGEGGSATFHLPPDLAFGDTPPPGSNLEAGELLIFEVKVLEVREDAAESPPAGAPRTVPPGLRPPPGPPPSMTPPPPPPRPPQNAPAPRSPQNERD